MKFRKFLISRIIAYLLTIWIGVTFIFFVPRMFPSDPVENMVGQMVARSGAMEPEQMEALRSVLEMQFGLEGSLWEQYVSFLWNGLLQFDFGPSLSNFPKPVNEIILTYLPYTLGLALTTTLLAWTIGNTIGLLAGFRKNKRSSKVLESIAIFIYPIPYFAVALLLQIVLGSVLGWFPITAEIVTSGSFLQNLPSIIYSSILPAISLLLIGTGWWIISMKSLSGTTAEEDFVHFARWRGLSEGTIGRSYVLRNSILTQVTALAMSLGGVFGGAIMTEVIFQYPGVGRLIQQAILASDYNMILGCITISIVAISTATFIVDLVYPFIDPRIRYG